MESANNFASTRWLSAAGGPFLGILLLGSGLSAQKPVGTVDGAQVQLQGTVQVQAGRPVVSSGTEIDVSQGDAELHLERGGTIRICGPARLTVIEGGGGAMLISLQQGGIELRYASPVPDSILTPDFRVDTVVPPGQFTSTSTSLALEAQGKLCIHNQGSALTLQAMASGQQRNLIAGDSLLFNPADGSVVASPACSCESPAPAAVPETPSQRESVGSLFPKTASLQYSNSAPLPPPAAASTTSPAPASVAAAPSSPAQVAAAPKPVARPAHPHHRSFLARMFGWLFGGGHKKSPAPAAPPVDAETSQNRVPAPIAPASSMSADRP